MRRPCGAPSLALAAAAVAVLWVGMRRGDEDGRGPTGPDPAAVAALASWRPGRPRTPLGRLAATLWAAPTTLLGLALAATVRGRVTVGEGTLEILDARGPLPHLLARRGFAATTLGQVVIVRSAAPDPVLLAHERSHARQAERLGPLFGPVYLVLLAVYGYRRHPLERAARLGAQRDPAARSVSPPAS